MAAAAPVHGGEAWRGEDPDFGGRALGCCERARDAVGSLVLGVAALLGAALLVLAPLQLSGAVHGLAPPCDAWYCL